MDILQALIRLRNDLKEWVTKNLVALDAKIESKTIPIDSELKTDSTNPVQNKAVAKEIFELDSEVAALNTKVGDASVAEQIENAMSNITDDGSGEFNIADPNGNVIFKADKDGIHTTDITANGDDFTIGDPDGNVVFKVNAAGAHTTKLELSSGDIDDQLDGIKANIAEVAGNAFSGDYDDLTNKPNIQDDESGEYIITDNDGNVVFKVDAAGAHTTEINLSGTNVKETLESLAGDIEDIETVKIPDLNAELAAHKADKENPHEVGFKQLKDNNITDDESGEVVYTDSNGNIIAKIDADGIKTTEVSADNVKVGGFDLLSEMNTLAEDFYTHNHDDKYAGITHEHTDEYTYGARRTFNTGTLGTDTTEVYTNDEVEKWYIVQIRTYSPDGYTSGITWLPCKTITIDWQMIPEGQPLRFDFEIYDLGSDDVIQPGLYVQKLSDGRVKFSLSTDHGYVYISHVCGYV